MNYPPNTASRIYSEKIVPVLDRLPVDGVYRLKRSDAPCRAWFTNYCRLSNVVLSVHKTGSDVVILRLK